MQSMKTIKLGFKLETKLHFNFMICCLQVHVILDFCVNVFGVTQLQFQLAILLSQQINFFLQLFLIIVHPISVLIEFLFLGFNLLSMLSLNFANQHLVVGATAVLEKNGKHFP